MKRFLLFVYTAVRYLLWGLSFVSLILIVPSLLHPLFTEYDALSKTVLRLPQPHFLIVGSFLFAALEVFLQIVMRRRFRSSIKDRALYTVLALFASYLISKNFNFFNQLYLVKYIPLAAICIWYLPYYGEYHVIKIESVIDPLTAFLKKIIQLRVSKLDFMRFVLIVALAVFVVKQSTPVVRRLIAYGFKINHRFAMNPHVEKIEPKIVYQGTKAIIYGKNLGLYDGSGKGLWLVNTTNNKKVSVELWTDHKITFAVPLDWNTGTFYLKIQKEVEWDGEEIVVESKVIKIKVISRTDGWDREDDEYFKQLNKINKEVLEINGYSSDQAK